MMSCVRFVFFALITGALSSSNDRKGELADVEKYELVRFNLNHFASDQQLEFDLFDTHYKVQLRLNEDLIGSHIDTKHAPCHYFGSVLEPPQNTETSYLSLSLCANEGIRGWISTDTEVISIMPAAYYLDKEFDRNNPHQFTDEHLLFGAPNHEEHSFVVQNNDRNHNARHLLGYNDINKVELYVMSDPALTKRFSDDYGSSRAYEKIKSFVLDVVNGASAVYEKKNWGPAGKISLHVVELEAPTSYSGAYSSLYPNFPFTDGEMHQFMEGRYNCKDPLKYGTWDEGGCMITGNAAAQHRDKAMLWKFSKWTQQYKGSKKFDDHLMLVGNKMAGIAGVAFRGGMCINTGNTAIVNAKYNKLISDSKTVAHELGHNFGMIHDAANKGVMGGWTSWDGQPSFYQLAYEKLNARFKEKDTLSCLRNGVRSFTKGSTSGRGSGGYTGGSGSTNSGGCLKVAGVNNYFNGEYFQDGTLNGRTAWKKDSSRYLYTALDGSGNKVWTMYRKKDGNYVNKNYYCYKTYVQSCSGNWQFYGSKQRNSQFGACGSFTDEELRCLSHNKYGDNIIVSHNGSLWDENKKQFELNTDECMNNKPIFDHIVNENVTYRLYYNEYNETADAEEVNGHWVITMNEFTEAQCEESHLLDCSQGKWQIYQGSNDSVGLVVDGSMSVLSVSGSTLATEANSVTKSAFFWIALVLLVIAVVAFAVFVYRRTQKEKAQKAAMVIEIEEESEEEEEEEEDLEVQLDGVDVEETNLTKTTA